MHDGESIEYNMLPSYEKVKEFLRSGLSVCLSARACVNGTIQKLGTNLDDVCFRIWNMRQERVD